MQACGVNIIKRGILVFGGMNESIDLGRVIFSPHKFRTCHTSTVFCIVLFYEVLKILYQDNGKKLIDKNAFQPYSSGCAKGCSCYILALRRDRRSGDLYGKPVYTSAVMIECRGCGLRLHRVIAIRRLRYFCGFSVMMGYDMKILHQLAESGTA